MTRKECLDAAAECVLQDRARQYGQVENNFERIADLWEAYLHAPISALDVAMMMALLKVARAKANPGHADSFVDLAGYAACGAELAGAEGGCFQNGNNQPEEPKFKRGDRVQYRVELPSVSDWIWRDATYLRPAFCWQQDGEHIVSSDDLGPVTVKDKDIRPAPKAEGCEEPEFKSGDKVEVHAITSRDLWEPAVVVEAYGKEGFYMVEYSDGYRRMVPSSLVRPAPKAEGVEELVQKDAPQTPQELYQRIVESNPATYKPRTPTGEELAEMAEETRHE